ncbi:hypothetical protein [Burkholderia cepacia]|uniref:hypothetical protein n=1 Tax=Burkholderia cepacia TaxID=292 RepID=UPI000F5B65D4|nr:hypothetical protein [Burkholderia cepacia]
MGANVTVRLIEYVAESMSLASAVAVVIPAIRFSRLQGHSKQMADIKEGAVQQGDLPTSEIADAIGNAKRRKSDGLYWWDLLCLWMGIALAIGASSIKLLWVLPNAG